MQQISERHFSFTYFVHDGDTHVSDGETRRIIYAITHHHHRLATL